MFEDLRLDQEKYRATVDAGDSVATELPTDVTDSQNPDTDGRLRNTDRAVLIGTTGAGKTTMARRIARALNMPHIEFDALRHGPNWTETPDDVFRERLRMELQGDRWVGDG